MMIANATGFGAIASSSYTCGRTAAGNFACWGLTSTATAAIKNLQAQLNRLASFWKRPQSLLTVDGKVGSQTTSAVGELGVPAGPLYPPPAALAAILRAPTPEAVTQHADELGAYFKAVAEKVGAAGVPGLPAGVKSSPTGPTATGINVGPTAASSASTMPSLPAAAVPSSWIGEHWLLAALLAIGAIGGTWALYRYGHRKGRHSSYHSRVSPRSA